MKKRKEFGLQTMKKYANEIRNILLILIRNLMRTLLIKKQTSILQILMQVIEYYPFLLT